MTGPDSSRRERIDLEPLLDVGDVCEYLRISESGVYRLIRAGDITTVKVGGRTRIEPAAVRTFIAAQRRRGQGPSGKEEAAA